jgi:hypothetical protein
MDMRGNWPVKVLKILAFVVVAAAVLSFIVMRMWNWLMPAVFGLRTIGYWQALGILILSKILFGGFRGRPGGRGPSRGRMMEKWAQMTPDEREKFREGMRNRCGGFAPPATEAKS